LVEALRALGYIEGQTIIFVTRAAENQLDRLPKLAAELVSSEVDIIVAVSATAIRAAKQATHTIPIVMAFWGGEGLVETGIVSSFARPGGNVTGVYMLAAVIGQPAYATGRLHSTTCQGWLGRPDSGSPTLRPSTIRATATRCRAIRTSKSIFAPMGDSPSPACDLFTPYPLAGSAPVTAAFPDTANARQDTFQFLARDVRANTRGFVGPACVAGLLGLRPVSVMRAVDEPIAGTLHLRGFCARHCRRLGVSGHSRRGGQHYV
jgi:hypothetical protein